MTRNNPQSRALESFVFNENLYMCKDSSHADIPYTRCCNASYSTLDHCIVSSNLSNDICKYQTMFIPNNFSDHFPIYLELNLDISYVQLPSFNITPKTNWRKCNNDCISKYKNEIESNLLNVIFNNDAITCRDVTCKAHTDYIIYLYKSIIEICCRASDKWLPTSSSNVKKDKTLPGWNDHIKPLFEDSLLCHDIWVQNGKPREGLIAQNMRITRARYHYAIRNAINDENRVRNDKMAEAISQKNDCNL